MKILCLGNNTEQTDLQTTKLANSRNLHNYGLLSDIDNVLDIKKLNLVDGCYHSSVYDMSPGRIVDLSKYFDQVIVLDQPKEMWPHPDAFYNTIKLKSKIKNLIFENDFTKEIDYWKNFVENNKSFCIFPFIELLVQNGSTTVCCRSSKEITTLEKINDYNNNLEYQEIRNKMIQGIKIPDHCGACYQIESQNIKSARQQETVEWANRLNLNSIDELKNINGPIYYEVRPSNNCNLQCRICSPQNSKLIQNEYNSLGWHDSSITYGYANFDFIDISKVKKLYVAES